MRSIRLLVAAAVLVLGASACGGSDNPAGTISEGDLPDGVKVEKVTHDDQAGQITCPQVNDAEDNHVMTPSENYAKDRRAAVSYELAGSHREAVSNSVWRLANPDAAVQQVADGLKECIAVSPKRYQRFRVKGYPTALGYTAVEGLPDPVHTRRILVPLSDRVVIVTTTRTGNDDFEVPPEDVLDQAVKVSSDAPEA